MKYKYVQNTSYADSTISVHLSDGRNFGQGQCVELTDEEHQELSVYHVLVPCTCVKHRPEEVKNDVKTVGKTADKA